MTTLARHGLPKTVLNGKDKRYIKVHNRYKALLVAELFRRLHASFGIRSENLRDPVAGKWKKLKPQTIKIKKELGVARPELINIRTGRLYNATKPGKVVGGRYYRRKDQVFKISPYTINFGVDVEYAEDVDQQRIIIPSDISLWVIDAHEAVIHEVKAMYDVMRANFQERAKASKRRRRPRP